MYVSGTVSQRRHSTGTCSPHLINLSLVSNLFLIVSHNMKECLRIPFTNQTDFHQLIISVTRCNLAQVRAAKTVPDPMFEYSSIEKHLLCLKIEMKPRGDKPLEEQLSGFYPLEGSMNLLV